MGLLVYVRLPYFTLSHSLTNTRNPSLSLSLKFYLGQLNNNSSMFASKSEFEGMFSTHNDRDETTKKIGRNQLKLSTHFGRIIRFRLPSNACV